MGQTTSLNKEQSDEFREQVILVSFIGSAAVNSETIALYVDDPDGNRIVWGISWRAAAYLSASMMVDAVRMLVSQGMEQGEAHTEVVAHYYDARERIVDSLNSISEEKGK